MVDKEEEEEVPLEDKEEEEDPLEDKEDLDL